MIASIQVRLFSAILLISISCVTIAQNSHQTLLRPAPHPRLLTNHTEKETIKKLIQSKEWARQAFNEIKQTLDPYVDRHQRDSTWIVSRLQMYWKTKATNVYIRAGVYAGADGEAPVPTVRFPGTRDNVSVYAAPRLEDIQPYLDDPRGLFLVNKTKPGGPMEWAEISKTGRIVDAINNSIMQLAYSAAFMHWITGEEKYARFAFNLFDTYMTGMYYRSEPKDITNGHHQTIVSLSTFEVIQEVGLLNNLTGIYDFLYPFMQNRAEQKLPLYVETFKKWAEQQIKNGVAYNNWNLMEARNILSIGSILEDNSKYKDGKGRQYYIDQVLNQSSERQWSLKKVMSTGYDSLTGLWNESPGYSMGVLGDFTGFVSFFDQQFNKDILPQLPLLEKAVLAIAQYLFPNGYASSFGDSHYRRVSTSPAMEMIANARKNNKAKQEERFTRYIKTIGDLNKRTGGQTAPVAGGHGGNRRGAALLLAHDENTTLRKDIAAGRIEDYVSPAFYSSHVSYFALRNGFDPKHGLMVAMSGSKGNHMHAGGISMEIFGKGIVLGPESGIGTSYFQQDYAEYYSQFPAHNTVAIDGISAYPVMKSNHGFELLHAYPASGVTNGHFPAVSFGDLFFLEPETMSDQRRLTSIVRTSDSTGYYVDIFRSRRKDGKDKMHDYFYHNLGQELTVGDASGKPVRLQPTQKLSFSGGHLFAYDYFWDKKSIATDQDFNAAFKLSIPGREDVYMNLWMKGAPEREIFAVKAPPSKAFGGNAMIPDSIAALPMPTIVVRQSGEAWKRPFAAIFEPTTGTQLKSVTSITSFHPASAGDDFVGLVAESKDYSKEFIFSSSAMSQEITHEDKSFAGTYGVISEKNGSLHYLFLGNGKIVAKGDYSINAKGDRVSAALTKEKDAWYVTASGPVTIVMPSSEVGGKTSVKTLVNNKQVVFTPKKGTVNGKAVVSFDLPEMSYTKLF